uniref:Tripsin inhibitor n=1 Tax=Cocculus hirsutus TaxID=421226 RepID=A2TJS6_9MAGN|nr:trypsin inhibitor [Cocculus hirsutus]AJU57502.1 tripsin inhibitor [Cocculus hirsutus]
MSDLTVNDVIHRSSRCENRRFAGYRPAPICNGFRARHKERKEPELARRSIVFLRRASHCGYRHERHIIREQSRYCRQQTLTVRQQTKNGQEQINTEQLSSRHCCRPFLPLPLAYSLHASRS